MEHQQNPPRPHVMLVLFVFETPRIGLIEVDEARVARVEQLLTREHLAVVGKL